MSNNNIKTKTGLIVSDKADKTVTVLVSRQKEHRIYKKKYRISKKFKCHDDKNQYKTGEMVEITECRPVSRDKCFKVLRRIK